MAKLSTLTLFLTIIGLTFTYSQEHETVLMAPENWPSEIIPFPIGFAQDIDLEGFEDLRFAPKWRDSTSQEFWTYTFVWYVDQKTPMTEEILTDYFNSYYDGLMGIDHKNKRDTLGLNQLDKSICLFIKSAEGFSGKMRVYDAFETKKYITLNIKVTDTICTSNNKQIISCDISPQPFDHEVWKLFDQVKLTVDCTE